MNQSRQERLANQLIEMMPQLLLQEELQKRIPLRQLPPLLIERQKAGTTFLLISRSSLIQTNAPSYNNLAHCDARGAPPISGPLRVTFIPQFELACELRKLILQDNCNISLTDLVQECRLQDIEYLGLRVPGCFPSLGQEAAALVHQKDLGIELLSLPSSAQHRERYFALALVRLTV